LDGWQEGERRWWVLHTKPRQEKLLAGHLWQTEIPFYLPLLRRTTVVRGSPLDSAIPLFPGYLFLMASTRERVEALATRRIVRCLEVACQRELWKDLSQVFRLLGSGLPVTPEEYLAPGAKVTVRSGPLAGLRGTVLREASRRRLVVRVDFIQRGVSAVVEDYMLAALNE